MRIDLKWNEAKRIERAWLQDRRLVVLMVGPATLEPAADVRRAATDPLANRIEEFAESSSRNVLPPP